ncbi:hypothetical protein GYMLUDRAFT_47409 [Collybiopsis luxurians FD-317 M1]|uniref:Amidohydrolase-related domain-containing protein n=1 Tax=Collybiopsis luxurians FD-317 M1 TaxID=944289 RepID=A0A0D0CDQ6_9AGAR|nr:hypothetical protein GYMLUDRAFT_47409 [Collybiopsis luxurians FD-317 M1]
MYNLHSLRETAFTFPAIDNHAHPLLKAQHRGKFPLDAVISEAEGPASKDATQTLACFRAATQLADILQVEKEPRDSLWERVKEKRDVMDYNELCDMFMKRCGIRSILLDDGLGQPELVEDWKWHRRFGCDTKRVVRVEIEAEKLLRPLLESLLEQVDLDPDTVLYPALVKFFNQLYTSLTTSARDTEVVAFKSIICYRGGLNIRPRSLLGISKTNTGHHYDVVLSNLLEIIHEFQEEGRLRLAHGAINEWIVHWALRVAGENDIPVQFHTGLGDNDISLVHASPAYMQPVIKDYPQTTFVLLHSSYPYTKEAGYLSAVYANVVLDFGEIFPFVSGPGQRQIIRQVLDLCPTNKILWSTDGHWHPESFYLGTIQARQALYDVLSDIVSAGELTEAQAVRVVQNALFWNSDSVYKLGLKPDI